MNSGSLPDGRGSDGHVRLLNVQWEFFWGGLSVVAEAGQAWGGEVNGGGRGDVGESEGVAADAGAEVEDFGGVGLCEAGGFVGGDGGVGGLFEGFGGGVDEVGGEVGEFLLGFGLELGEGEGGVDGGFWEGLAEFFDLGDGGWLGELCDGVAEGLAEGGVEELQSFGGNVGIVWCVGHGDIISHPGRTSVDLRLTAPPPYIKRVAQGRPLKGFGVE